jgi:hypothetical protein
MGMEMEMKTYKITNTAKNKVVLKKQFSDAADAFGKYVSTLMLVGIIPMRDSSYSYLGNDEWSTVNGWTFKVEEVS